MKKRALVGALVLTCALVAFAGKGGKDKDGGGSAPAAKQEPAKPEKEKDKDKDKDKRSDDKGSDDDSRSDDHGSGDHGSGDHGSDDRSSDDHSSDDHGSDDDDSSCNGSDCNPPPPPAECPCFTADDIAVIAKESASLGGSALCNSFQDPDGDIYVLTYTDGTCEGEGGGFYNFAVGTAQPLPPGATTPYACMTFDTRGQDTEAAVFDLSLAQQQACAALLDGVVKADGLVCEVGDPPMDCPGECTPIDGYSDDFSSGSLDGWTTAPELAAVPEIVNGEACSPLGSGQSVAIQECVEPAAAWTITYDFRASSDAGIESYALFRGGETLWLLGCNGGHNDMGCGLAIMQMGPTGGAELAAPTDSRLKAGVDYTIVATADASGGLTVSVLEGGTVLNATSAKASGPIAVDSVGFVVGRDATSPTCLDDFAFTSTSVVR